jgi:hypothetical protein
MRFTITHLSQFEALYVPVPRLEITALFRGIMWTPTKSGPGKGIRRQPKIRLPAMIQAS